MDYFKKSTELDSTVLRNGMYDLRLDVTDAMGISYTDSTVFVVKGGMKVGNFNVSFVDMSVTVSGIPIQIIRKYDSRDQHSAGGRF